MATQELSQKLKQGRLSRRDFLTLLWWGAAGLLTAEATAAAVKSLWPRVEAGSFGSEVVAGRVEDFPVASITYFKETRFYLSRLETGFLALYRKCTHLGCVVPWREEEKSEDTLAAQGRFNCPCHSSIFNRKGEVRGGPAPRPLDLFSVSIVGGEVVVDTGTVIQRAKFEESQVAGV